MSNDGWGILTLIVVLGVPWAIVQWLNRGKIKVCLDEYREIMCEWFTPEEYNRHLLEQRRIEAHIRRRRCSRELGKECV